MATVRRADRNVADATPNAPRKTSRFGAALASPLGILVMVPGLVALVGIFLTFGGDQALRRSNLGMARDRLSEQTRLVAASVRDALEQSGPILDRLVVATREHRPDQPFEAFAHTLANIMSGRPGVAYVSASFPDGTFQGAYLDQDGATRFQDSRVETNGTRVRRYNLERHGALRLHLEERSQYDPRQRGFYRVALERGARSWTAPYPFYMTHFTGVTRTEPVYAGTGSARRLIAVVTVDFDVNALSTYLRGRQLPGMHALLFAADGTLLAYPQAQREIQRLPLRSDRSLHYRDLKDPVLASFFASFLDRGQTGAQELHGIEAEGEPYLTSVAIASNDPALPWYVAYLVPESYFLRALRQYERRSLIVGGIAVLTAMVVGWLFARHVVRVQREAAEARAEAQEARRAVRELGSYRLVACLGRGGMGEVWKAEHRLLAREAAIKLIKPDDSGVTSTEMRARFRREAETLANLRCRNTIELFDYGVSDDGTFYYVMELLDGMDLETLVLGYGPQPAARVIEILAQACNSLAEAHEAGLVHRDVKPANLFICRAAEELDVVKVLDFGLVRSAAGRLPGVSLEMSGELRAALGPSSVRAALAKDGSVELEPVGLSDTAPQLTGAGGLMGTPGYMAPEQALGQAVDHRADLYALGCVAFWLLTGRMVFDDDNPMRLMISHVQERTPDLRPLVRGYLPDELVELINACLAKSAADRPSSAREVRRVLRSIAIPREASWTAEQAEVWWNKHRPRRRSYRATDVSREFNVAVTAS